MFPVYLKMWGLIKCFENTIKQLQTERILFFIVDYESYYFLLVDTFVIITFPNFFAFFTYAYMDPTCFVKCTSLLIFSPRSPGLFNSLLIPEDQTKKSMDVLAAYLLPQM